MFGLDAWAPQPLHHAEIMLGKGGYIITLNERR